MNRAAIAKRIIREIEDAVTGDYPGDGLLGLIAPGYGLGRMFIELPHALQWQALYERVNWTGLTASERHDVMMRVLEDVRAKIPEEIHPETWFDGVMVAADSAVKVHDLADVKQQREAPERRQNLDERVCAPERVRRR
jgi:hypothetical protein